VSANGASEAPVISGNGRRVVFQSRASNLPQLPGTTANYQFYARDLDSGTTLLVSRGSSQVISGPTPGAMTLSQDGNWIAFVNGAASPLYLCDLRTDTNTANTFVGNNADAPSLSADGRWLAFQQWTNPTNIAQVWLLDAQSGSKQLISVNGNWHERRQRSFHVSGGEWRWPVRDLQKPGGRSGGQRHERME